jgi:hypothetical protein
VPINPPSPLMLMLDQFFVRGVTYQVPDLQDPISDARLPQLRHDVELFKELGLNTLFVCL